MLKTHIAARALFCSILFGLIAAVALAKTSEEKVALVIGNSAYEHVPSLDNPANDAEDIAAALKRLDFDVTLLIDQSDIQLRQAIRTFAKDARAADLSIVYYAGHGIEIDKVNYLIPVNAELLGDSDADFEAIRLSDMLRAISGGDGVSLMLVDACRDNPFASSLRASGTTRSIGNGLVRVNPRGGVLPGGVLVSYAAREGEFALDGEGRNSPYANGLLAHLEEPGLEVSKFFRKVRDNVFESTGGQQEPFTYGSLPSKDIYLAAAPPPQQERPETQNLSLPEDFFRQYSKAQRLDSAYLYKKFLKEYGYLSENPLVVSAQRRAIALSEEAAEKFAKNTRKPWLEPENGFNGSGEAELTLPERQQIQASLSYLGFDTGGIDGQFGPKTENAIYAARISLGLPSGNHVDATLLRNIPDPAVIQALKSATAQVYKTKSLPDNLEPRLAKAISVFGGSEILFDYFRGHLYIAVLGVGHDGWNGANKRARRAGGHLATIGTAAENRFIFRLFSKDRRFLEKDSSGYWHGPAIGLYQREGSGEPKGGWSWVTAEPVRYTNWAAGQPDNHSGGQKYATFFSDKKRDPNGLSVSQWDDVSDIWLAYIVEIE